MITARSVVVSVPTVFASYRSPLSSVTTMRCAPETTWLLVTMLPSLSRIAPVPCATPLCVCVWIETTDFETLFETAVQSGVSPPSTFAVPSPPLLVARLVIEPEPGMFTQPFASAAYPRPRQIAAVTTAATTATSTLFGVRSACFIGALYGLFGPPNEFWPCGGVGPVGVAPPCC